ncbi:major facilitator superfamily domain-containing protein 4 [Elysia marginata]|uniref:Major facilitator superfamily domain-containing protein 4 n=1 Tax=Elysia marginata TaxID=1093978 RepID=A0AAV4H7T9_9GAST|nr:major facilitator superfamily domain-containing protein 4 [Elysia marginata]
MSPTVMSMAEQFIDINPSITTCLVVVAALGEALCPVIVGNLVVNLGPSSFLLFCLAFSLAAVFLYLALSMSGKQTAKYNAAKPESWIWLSKKEMVVDTESTFIKPSGLKYYSRMSEDSDSTSNLEMAPVGSRDNLTVQ